MQKSILAMATGLVLFAATAMAQVEQPSQINIQGTALITKDSTTDSATHSATQSGGLLVGYSYQFNQWAGVEGNYGYSRNTQNYFGSFGQSWDGRICTKSRDHSCITFRYESRTLDRMLWLAEAR